MFRSATERAGLQLIVDCQPTSDVAYVDRDMWEKIVLNLVSNAFKFTFEGEIAVSLAQAGHIAELRVRDTGVGIPPRKFLTCSIASTAFPTRAAAPTKVPASAGAWCTNWSNFMADRCASKAPSDEAAHSSSAFRWVKAISPLSRLAASARWPQPQPARTPSCKKPCAGCPTAKTPRKKSSHLKANFCPVPCPPGVGAAQLRRVLIADDNADMRQYLSRLLSERYDVVSVADGKLAVECHARSTTPDLVLSDIMMPNLDGFGLLQAMRCQS